MNVRCASLNRHCARFTLRTTSSKDLNTTFGTSCTYKLTQRSLQEAFQFFGRWLGRSLPISSEVFQFSAKLKESKPFQHLVTMHMHTHMNFEMTTGPIRPGHQQGLSKRLTLLIASFPGLPHFFCSSVCVDNNTHVEVRAGLPHLCNYCQRKPKNRKKQARPRNEANSTVVCMNSDSNYVCTVYILTRHCLRHTAHTEDPSLATSPSPPGR